MGAERVRITFRYRRGDLVHIGRDPQVYTVRRQRYTVREVMPPLIEYLLDDGSDEWVSEADLRPA